MKQRFILYRRKNGKFYCEDTVTKKQASLKTCDESEALVLLNARNGAFWQPILNLRIARTYLSATDSEAAKRTHEIGLHARLRHVVFHHALIERF